MATKHLIGRNALGWFRDNGPFQGVSRPPDDFVDAVRLKLNRSAKSRARTASFMRYLSHLALLNGELLAGKLSRWARALANSTPDSNPATTYVGR